MEQEKFIKAVDMRNNRVVFISEACWPEYRRSVWFDRVDGLVYVYMKRYDGGFDFFELRNAEDRRFDELFSAQGNLIRVTYSVNEKLFKTRIGCYTDFLDRFYTTNDNFPNCDGLTITALTDKYALGFNWYFDNDRANDKRLFFETLKYIHGVWRETAIGAQIADGDGLDRELQCIKTDDGELKFSVILNAYKYCKLIGFTTSFDLFNAALLTQENGLSLFVRREPELFFTDKVEVL